MDQGNRRCTIDEDDTFCDAPSVPDMPFPICSRHAVMLYAHMRELLADKVSDPLAVAAAYANSREEQARKADEYDRKIVLGRMARQIAGDPSPTGAVVYYLRIGDLIKIGTTRDLRQRLWAYPPSASLLATEPGDTGTELRRHMQFEHLRAAGREWFRPDPELLAHITALQAASRRLTAQGRQLARIVP